MPFGSARHTSSMQAAERYHEAKRHGKTAVMIVSSEDEKVRLCTAFAIDPADVVLKSELKSPRYN